MEKNEPFEKMKPSRELAVSIHITWIIMILVLHAMIEAFDAFSIRMKLQAIRNKIGGEIILLGGLFQLQHRGSVLLRAYTGFLFEER